MSKATQTTVQCTNCAQPIRVTVMGIIDAQLDPQAKMQLLSGRVNTAACPNCGAPNTVLTPLLYHDAEKEMLVSYVPMELKLSKDAQERTIGDMVRTLTAALPQGSFKAYMLQPRHALTMQGLIDQVLQSDGVTPEMLEAQRARVRLVESFLQIDPEGLPALIQQHDDKIDAQFFQTMTVLAQRMLQEGRQDMAEQVIMVQNVIVENSTFGKNLLDQQRVQAEIVQEVADAINALGEQAQRGDLLDLVTKYAGDEARLQAFVGLIRPVLDYQFFQELTQRIGQSPADSREKLETLRDQLVNFTAQVDAQAQSALQEAAGLLQAILSSPNPDALIEANLPVIDYTFMQVLAANVQEAERRQDMGAASRLKTIYNKIVAALQAQMPPELRFINELLSVESEADALSMVGERAGEFGEELLDAMDAVGEQLAGQGNSPLLQRLAVLRNEAVQALG